MAEVSQVPGPDEGELDEIELAVVAYREDGRWELEDLPDRALVDIDAVARELSEEYDDADALALISVGEDFALLVRAGAGRPRVVLSDLTAATDWTLARSVTDLLGLDVEDDDEPAPAGDLTLLADLGLSADDLAELVDDEPHPDDLLVGVADELGFGDELEDLLDDDESEDDDESADEGDDDEDDDPDDDDELDDDEDDFDDHLEEDADLDEDEDDDEVAEDEPGKRDAAASDEEE